MISSRWLLVCSVAVLLTAATATRAEGPAVGDAPPALKLDRLLQAPEDAAADWDALRGRVVVLEFWATWCGPCVAAFPHLNALVDKYDGKPVTFIAISEEKRSVVEAFLKKRALKTWIGLDAGGATFDAYGVKGIPQTVIVDKAGKIVGVTFPDMLTEKVLDAVLAGQDPGLPNPSHGETITAGVDPQSEDQTPPLFQAVIRPTTGDSIARITSPNRFTAKSMSVRDAISTAYEMRPNRVLTEGDWPTERYTITIALPRGCPADMSTVFQQLLQWSLGVQATRVTYSVDAYVMTYPNGRGGKLKESDKTGSHKSTADGYLDAGGESIDTLATFLEEQLAAPVVDETGLTGRYDFQLVFDAEEPTSAIDVVAGDFGIKMTKAKRDVEMLVVSFRN